MTQGNMDTMLTENILNNGEIIESLLNDADASNQLDSEDFFDVSNRILTIAPGEGKMLVFSRAVVNSWAI